LKPGLVLAQGVRMKSPPHGGVWIETGRDRRRDEMLPSHPLTGGCGLKLISEIIRSTHIGHPLTGGCGLKPGCFARCRSC